MSVPADDSVGLRARVPASTAEAVPVGRAVALALAAEKRSLQRALQSLHGGTADALSLALLSLRSQAERLAASPDALRWVGHDPLLSPLLEAACGAREASALAKAWRLLDWLAALPGAGEALLVRLLGACADEDTRVRLGAALSVAHVYSSSSSSAHHHPLPAAAALSQAAAALLASAQRQGCAQAGAPGPTRLAAAACDALLLLSARLCAAPDQGDALQLLWSVAPSLEALAGVAGSWGAAVGAQQTDTLRSRGLAQVARHVAALRGHAAQPRRSDDAQAEAPLAVAQRALGSCWAHYAALMLCAPLSAQDDAQAARIWVAALEAACAAQAEGEWAQGRAEAAQLHALACLALLLGRHEQQPGACSAALASPDWARAPRALLEALRSPSALVTDLAARSLRLVLLAPRDGAASSAGAWSASAESALGALLPLLDERDGVSRAGVLLTGELVARQPGLAALQVVFEKLGAPCDHTRRNALEALAEALARGAGRAPATDGGDAHALQPGYAALLARHILPCLSDASLPARAAAAALLGWLSPACVLPPLMRLCAARDARTRSAAALALTAVLRHHAPPHRALAALLRCLTHPAAAEGADGDGEGEGEAEQGGDTAVERAICCLGKWAADDVAPSAWPPLIDQLAGAMAAHPEHAALVRCASALGPGMGALGGPGAHVLRRVHASLAAQPEAPPGAGEVFARLQPLLLMRVLPVELFSEASSEGVLYGGGGGGAEFGSHACVADTLMRRMCDAREATDVRRLSAELYGRLRPLAAWPPLLARLLEAARTADWTCLRACLFAVCAALSARGADAVPGGLPPRSLLAALTSVLVHHSDGASAEAEEEVMKTQMGCIDCLSFLCAAQLGSAPAPAVRIVELGGDAGDGAPEDGVADVLAPLLEVVTCATDAPPWHAGAVPPAMLPTLRACCANVVISVSKRTEGLARGTLARRVLPVVAAGLARGAMPPAARAGAYQLLFVVAHHAGAQCAPFAADLAELAARTLRSSAAEQPDTRIAAAKLLTALLGGEAAVTQALAGSLRAVAAAVRDVARLDACAELRGVCETLARALRESV